MTKDRFALEEVLRALDNAGALTTGAIAQRLGLTELDVRILMRSAEANRLVYSTRAGEWAITERGRLHTQSRQ